MKKLLAAVLTLTLLGTMSATAFATDIKQDSQEQSGSTDVTFSVAPTYTVTIPAKVDLEKDANNRYTKDLTISAENVRLVKGKELHVALSSDFKLTNASGTAYEWPYTVKVGTSDRVINNNDIVAAFKTMTAEQSEVLHFAADNPEYAGDYSDTVTFTISIADGPQ